MSSAATERMARTVAGAWTSGPVLIGRVGASGVGVGRALVVESAGDDSGGVRGATAVGTAGVGQPADPAAEADRLRAALETAADDLTELAEQTTKRAGEEVGAIFVAQALFARDPGIVDPALEEIAAGVPAADAIMGVTARHADRLAGVDDDYFRERAADVRDIGRRVSALLRGERRPDLWHADGHPAVLIATDLDPSAIATVRRELVAGIAMAGGTATGHAAIVARALGIPLVLGLGEAIASVPDGADVVVDGSTGRLLVEPAPATLAALRSVAPTAPLGAPPGAADVRASTHGVAVTANVSSPLEAAAAAAAGADGVGLVRTELLFLGRHTPPTVDEQRAIYARIRAALGDRPIVFRTLDVGGDKPAPWQTGPPEGNPALGIRGVRLGQRHPDLLDDQLRALIDAAGDGELRVMLPMVAVREELDGVRARLDELVAEVSGSSGVRPRAVRLGVMIEVPSAAVMADAFARAADFLSIGTNDLIQYVLAADRTNPELADLASPLQPAVLRLIDGVVRAARQHGRHVAVCGEAAGDPSVIPLLVGLGVEELSVTPGAIESVRATLAGLDPAACEALASRALRVGSLTEVRAVLEPNAGA
jgi:phosphoenolpyruvate-protein phosphotransferase